MNGFIRYENASLKDYHTLKMDITAHTLLLPADCEDFVDILKSFSDKKIIILGRGSNILFSKAYYGEEYVFVSTKLLDKIFFGGRDGDNLIHCGCGVGLGDLAWKSMEHGYGNFYFLEDIPGSVGGAVVMNAGTKDGSIGDSIVQIKYFDKTSQAVRIADVTQEDFSYRHSPINPDLHVVLEVTLQGRISDRTETIELMLNRKRSRYAKQPREYANAGSTFKRPCDSSLYVWQMLVGCGLNGKANGDAQIPSKHPAILINRGNCTPEQMTELLNLCIDSVRERYGIVLEPEWKII